MTIFSRALPGYERLSGQDAAFLSFEGPARPMHIGCFAIIDATPWRAADGSLDTARVADTLASRAATIPGLDKRLARTPIGGWPVWQRIAHPDYHAQITVLEPAATEEGARAAAEAQLETHLDRRRPLWRIAVIPGINDGASFGILFMAHHGLVDGIAGMDLVTRFLDDPGTLPTIHPAPPAPSRAHAVALELAYWARLPLLLILGLVAVALSPRRRGVVLRRTRAFVRTCIRLLTPGPQSGIVGPNESVRSISWFTVPERALLSARRALLGSPNDMVLAAVAHALAAIPNHGPFRPTRAAIPVSFRKLHERHALGNRIGLLLTPLEVPTPSTHGRVAAIGQHTSIQKLRGDAEGYQVLCELTAWLGQWSQRFLHLLAGRLRSYGILITNVPAPSRGAYSFGGATVNEIYPLVPLFGAQTVSVAVIRYLGGFRIGVTSSWADREALETFTHHLREGFALLSRPAQTEAAVAIPGERAVGG